MPTGDGAPRRQPRGGGARPQLVAAASAQLGLEPAEVEAYLTRHLSYRLGASELRSLDEFFRRAHQHRLLPPPRPLQLAG